MRRIMLLVGLLFVLVLNGQAQAIKVMVVPKGADAYELQRGNAPYYVKGAGGSVHMDKVVAAGGNSVRLWGAENAQEVLDEAQKKGLTVMLGLWMPPERHGFDYSDKWACEDQVAQFKSVVNKYKNHPALLLWGVGNEVDLAYTDFAVWHAVQNIAARTGRNPRTGASIEIAAQKRPVFKPGKDMKEALNPNKNPKKKTASKKPAQKK